MELLFRFFFGGANGWIGRVCAGILFGGIFSAAAIGKSEKAPTASTVSVAFIVGGIAGGLAVLFLERVDSNRARREARDQQRDSEVDADDEEQSFSETLLKYSLIIGFALGAFSAFCGIVMGIIHVVQTARGH